MIKEKKYLQQLKRWDTLKKQKLYEFNKLQLELERGLKPITQWKKYLCQRAYV